LSVGLIIHLLTVFGLIKFGGRPASSVTGIFATIFSVVGFQILSLGLGLKTYSWSSKFDEKNSAIELFYNHFKLERGLILGTMMILFSGLVLCFFTIKWLKSNMLPLPHPEWIAFAATLFIIGFGIIFVSLFMSAMSIKRNM
jgi:hypothetical protein